MIYAFGKVRKDFLLRTVLILIKTPHPRGDVAFMTGSMTPSTLMDDTPL
jgi:hypothetical protein